MPLLTHAHHSSRGLSLLEVVVTLAVLSAVTALVMPTLAGMVEVDNEQATRRQAEVIWRAIYGDPAKAEFGYLGDMGRLPTVLDELVAPGAQMLYHTHDSNGTVEHEGSVGTGWRGPYLKDFFATADLLRDAWGQPFSFANGQVTSAGPDGNAGTTADNIVFPMHAPASTGSMFVSILANRIPDPLGTTAKLFYVSNGEQVSTATKKHLSTDTTFDGFWFEGVPHGLQVVRVRHTAATGTNVCVTVSRVVPVAVYAGQQVVRDIRMVSAADVKVTDNPCTIPD